MEVARLDETVREAVLRLARMSACDRQAVPLGRHGGHGAVQEHLHEVEERLAE